MVNVGNDGKVANMVHGVEGVVARMVAGAGSKIDSDATRNLASGLFKAAVERQVVVKKKARRKIDAPSNKTYGNCMLVGHCNQKRTAGNRANAAFLLVADCQQGKLFTMYSQSLARHSSVDCADRRERLKDRKKG